MEGLAFKGGKKDGKKDAKKHTYVRKAGSEDSMEGKKEG